MVGLQSKTDYIVFSRIRGMVEKGLGTLFITSSISHFFNKTDFKQYLFKKLGTQVENFVKRIGNLK